MSVTPSPKPDPFDPVNQLELSRVIPAAFGLGGIDGFEGEAGSIYSAERKRPLVRALAKEAIIGRWLGKTQWEISEKLTKTKDRAWLPRARYQGRISLDLFLRLWFHPDRPTNSKVTENHLRAEMNRSAAIGIGRATAKLLPASFNVVPEFLTELNYELGCIVVDPNSPWPHARQLRDAPAMIRMVHQACGAKGADVIPPSYTDTQRRHTTSEITRLTNDPNAAFERLEYLSLGWRGILVATADLMESIWSREARDVA
jgi:hypothetical protein